MTELQNNGVPQVEYFNPASAIILSGETHNSANLHT